MIYYIIYLDNIIYLISKLNVSFSYVKILSQFDY